MDAMTPVPPESSSFMVAAYLLYLLVSITLTVWVARTLQRNGAHFLHDAFLGKERLAESVNSLKQVRRRQARGLRERPARSR